MGDLLRDILSDLAIIIQLSQPEMTVSNTFFWTLISSRTVGHTRTVMSVAQISRPNTKFGLNFRPVDVQVGSALFVSIKCLFVAACKGSKGTGLRQRDSPALEMKARPHTARAPQGSRAFQRGSEAPPMVGPPWPMRLMVVAGHCLHALIVPM